MYVSKVEYDIGSWIYIRGRIYTYVGILEVKYIYIYQGSDMYRGQICILDL